MQSSRDRISSFTNRMYINIKYIYYYLLTLNYNLTLVHKQQNRASLSVEQRDEKVKSCQLSVVLNNYNF